MYLDLDICNSRSKWRLGEGTEASRGVCASTQQELVSAITALNGNLEIATQSISAIRVASVKGDSFTRSFETICRSEFSANLRFALAQKNTLGVQNSYREPEKMGVDRWCAIAAAVNTNRQSAPNAGLIAVIDAGSALTIDFVMDDGEVGEHLGGFIVPGFAMQMNALLGGTQRITIDTPRNRLTTNLGRDTDGAVTSGILAGRVSIIDASIHRQQQICEREATAYLTGGDAELLQPFLTTPVLYRSELVLDGIGLVLP